MTGYIAPYDLRSICSVQVRDMSESQEPALSPLGHSMTIIGIEKTAKNALHLLVFNPGRRYRDNTHLSRSRSTRQRQAILDAYRLQLDSLRKYSELEVL